MIEHKLPTGDTLLLVEVPPETTSCWLHLNVVCYKTKTGFGEAYSAGEIFTEHQAMESLEVTCNILGVFLPPATIDFEVKEEWVNKQLSFGNYKDYLIKGTSLAQYGSYVLNTVKDSFISLLKSLTNSKGEKYVVLLKK